MSPPVGWLLVLGATALAACGSGREPHARANTAEPARVTRPAPATVARDAGTPLSEAAARELLARQFRAAGYRVRYDVPLARAGAFEVTVDGYDPERKVGFEYVAAAERDTDLDRAERAALARDPEHRILVVDATGATADIEARAARFLAGPTGPASQAR